MTSSSHDHPDRPKPASAVAGQESAVVGIAKKDQGHRDLDADASMALEQARKLKPGPERAEAMKQAGLLRQAADMRGLFFSKRGRPRKT